MTTEPGMHRSDELAGKVALVTGAGRNIGRATALCLAAGGARVALNTRSSMDKVLGVVEEIKSLGAEADAFQADVANMVEVQGMADAVIKRFGRLDILVLNAAIREKKHFEEIDLDSWRRMMSANLDSVFICVKAFLPALKASGDGRIITFGGINSLAGSQDAHLAAAKHGVVGLTKTLAQELGQFGIRANCVSPGQIATVLDAGKQKGEMKDNNPLGRRGTPFEVAGMVRALCGPSGAYVSGQTLHVNGGVIKAAI